MSRALTKDDVQTIIDGGSPPEGFDSAGALAFIEARLDEDDQEGAEMAHAVARGLCAYCEHYNGGQGSGEYRVLCQLTRPGMFRPGAGGVTLRASEDHDAIAIYEALGGTHEEVIDE